MTDNGRYNVIGTRPIRHDGEDKVTGRAVYGADVRPADLLHGKILRSPHAHARIKRIDTSKAELFEGVRAVATADDLVATVDKMSTIGETTVNIREIASNSLASDKVLYKGHAIAAIAATSPHIAEEALELIEVEYEILPAVVDVLEAMKDDAPLLDENRTTRELGEDSGRKSNVSSHNQQDSGDVAAGFAAADVVVEREFRTATIHQGYIEPHVTTVLWKQDGSITVWVSTQGAFQIRDQVAEVLQVPISKVKVIPCEIGGGFGGKFPIYMEPAAAVLSHKTGRPVKMAMSRAEVFEGSGPAPGGYIKCKMGVTNDGQITAAQAYMAYEAGAFPGSAVGAGAACIFGPYNIPNVHIDAYDVVVNKPKSTAYRAPGAPNAAHASESVLDELAIKIGMDPLQIRLKNASQEGTRRADGTVYKRIGCVETVEAARDSEHYKSAKAPGVGRGVASGFWFNGGGQSAATIVVATDGTVSLLEGSTDIGGSRAAMAMIVAETLGIGVDDVKPAVVDTDSIGFHDGTGGSRVTYATGHACYNAAIDTQKKMAARAAVHLEVEEDSVAWQDNAFVCTNDPSKRLTFAEVAAQQGSTGGPIEGTGSINASGAGNAFATHIVDVAVDEDTGKVQILRYTSVQDVGKAIHPSYVEGQIQGGAAQGIGWALSEGYFYNEDGTMANPTFLDYRMPTALDLPMLECILVEVPNPASPHGIRGVGEVPIVPPMAAIANAINDAIGVRLTELPMSPDKVLKGLQSKTSEYGEAAG
ncbi:MAG: xanthine dehydrogenase family protein molybdopterin-binding subunit [Gemmatimonadetes bacterium]|nr:xanthine dehydrogenase family protein molybdopterin-binding subunit [Gemmatimonadota bacterium]MBT6148184.1 xanthine dehydrogenase family protein molybdopterin-binding subunit [Gemmatimonadota bacterium]MBT7863883.1 xanthine dehydrogenase family protein molybdopterin-binding subunit [Gemmatimonadota bacterium]